MEKSPDAFRTISEVADWLGVQTHVLRFWESKFSQVKPVKRAGGRRYYRPSDMVLLGGIKKLLHDDGMTIKGVQQLIREKGISHISSFSQSLETAAEKEIEGTAEPAPEDAENVVHFKARQEDPAPAAPANSGPETTDAEPVASPDAPEAEDAATAHLPSFLTQPMGGDEPEAPKALQVDAPDPPNEDDITADPGVLRLLAGIAHLSPEQAREMAPLVGRLAVLRDRLATASG